MAQLQVENTQNTNCIRYSNSYFIICVCNTWIFSEKDDGCLSSIVNQFQNYNQMLS